jgi:hypothetical protein
MANEPIDAKSADASVAAVRGENTVQRGSGVVGISPGGSVPPPFDVGDGAAVLGSAGFQGTGVFGGATGPGVGVFGNCKDAPPDVGIGVVGQGASGTGVQGTGGKAGVSGFSAAGVGVHGQCSGSNSGVLGESDTGQGVLGRSRTNHAVQGESDAGRGVVGISKTFVGTTGQSTTSDGVFGESDTGIGVHGTSRTNHAVHGESAAGRGVIGISQTFIGVTGMSTTSDGVFGGSDTGPGVHGTSRTNHAVHGESAAGRGVVGISQTFVGVTGQSTSNDGVLGISTSGFGVHGKGGLLAGFFEGDVSVTGKITVQGDIVLTNADCAEDFDIFGPDPVEPGTVMVLGSEGSLSASHRAYDKRVAGVISGAGDYRPGIVLDQRETKNNRQPIALLGKVFCKVDAQFGAIEIGDLLTTSPTPGHAMKTSNPFEAFGAVIGKALKPLSSGQGLIPILITLQ